MLKYKVLRSKYVKVFDQYYLKEMMQDELDAALDNAFVKLEKTYEGKEIRKETDLCRFLEVEATIPFEDGQLPYKVFALEGYSESETVLMWKCHHALADGMSLMGLLTSL